MGVDLYRLEAVDFYRRGARRAWLVPVVPLILAISILALVVIASGEPSDFLASRSDSPAYEAILAQGGHAHHR